MSQKAMAFSRHRHAEAIPAIEALARRVRQADCLDDDERAELRGMLEEGLGLLKA